MIDGKIIVLTGGENFPANFLQHAWPGALTEPDESDADLLVAPAGAYPQGEPIGARRVVVLSSAEGMENEERAWREAFRDCVVLRLPPLVGTGMTGRWRRMAHAIHRGSLILVKDNPTRASILHARDLAPAIEALMNAWDRRGDVDTFLLDDGRRPRVNDIAEALAVRMKNKRIAEFASEGKARRVALMTDIFSLGTTHARSLLSESLNPTDFSSEPFRALTGFEPTDTVEFLKTHDYGDDDV